MKVFVALIAAAALLASQAAYAECKAGPEKLAFYKQCVATQKCDFDPMAVCPDSYTQREAYAECAEEVNKTFLICLENCLNRSNVEFGCPLQKLK
jgi:hypothetical protein